MARKKPKPKPGQRNTKPKPVSSKAVLDDKQHVSPVVAIAIIAVFLAIAGVSAWAFLRPSGEESVLEKMAKKENSPENATNVNGNKTMNSDEKFPWNSTKVSKQVWQTENDQEKVWQQIDDPSKDGWDTEVLSSQVTGQLNKIKKLLNSSQAIDAAAVNKLCSTSVEVESLRPEEITTVFEDTAIKVERGNFKSESKTRFSGAEGLANVLAELVEPYKNRESIRMKLKVLMVEPMGDYFQTRQTTEFFGPVEGGLMEENATWIAQWKAVDGVPVLTQLKPIEYETSQRFGKTLFSDCTDSILGKVSSFQKQLLQGYNHWLDRSQFHRFLSILGNPGIAIGDVNSDGLDDIYVCQESGLPNLLYLQNEDGSLRDVSRESGADWIQNSSTALIADFNNDGNKDLAVAITGGVVIASGNGNGKFSLQKVLDTGDHVLALAAADYDLDGKLDLYVGVYYPEDIDGSTDDVVVGSGGSFNYTDANDGGRNSLFKNVSGSGQWEFVDVTETIGIDQNNRRYTLAASWEDVDNDGDQDLYVANDFGLNNLYRNDLNADGSGSFTDVAIESGSEDSASGMSVSWGDYDRDGWMDLYVSNMFSYAGHRITYQENFRPEDDESIRKNYQRFARGNTLLKNNGQNEQQSQLTFQDLSIDAGVNRGRWAWSSKFADLNNDGWEDLLVANGYISTADSGDL